MSQGPSKQKAALALIARKLRVLPIYSAVDGACACDKKRDCDSPAKHPMTQNGLHDATLDAIKIERWWSNVPDANVAVRTGAVSGIWVLDLDGPAGIEALVKLEAAHGALPRTPSVRTGGGGRHFYFAMLPGLAVANATKLGGMPIDVRGEGGYVLVPPSVHASGAVYEWEVSLEDAPLAFAPAWLIDFVAGETAPPADETHPAGRSGLKLRVGGAGLASDPGAPEGQRHARALSLVGAQLAQGDSRSEVEAAALEWTSRCNPPMPEAEIRRIVNDLAEKQRDKESAPPPWEPATPFSDIALPAFPIDALPEALRRYAVAVATATQTPFDLVALLGIAVIAAASAKRVEVFVKQGYVEPVNLFVAVALPPASRKSTVFSQVTRPLGRREMEEAARLSPEIASAKRLSDINEIRLKQLQAQAGRAAPEEQARLVEQATELARAIAATEPPSAPRLVVQDITAERLGTFLHENGGRIGVFSAEGDVFEIMAGRYSKGSGNFAVFLQGHAGDDLRVDRVNRPPEFVSRPALTVGLAVQPDVIRGLADKPGFRGKGLLGRFLYALPASLVGSRLIDPPPAAPDVVESYERMVLRILSVEPQGNGDAHPLRLDEGARREWLSFAAWVEPQLAEGGDLACISDWGGKLVGAVIRIAGLLHMARHAGEDAPWARPIDAGTFRRAVAIGRYLIPHARAAFASMGADPAIADARFVLAWACRSGEAAFSLRDAFEGTKGRFDRVDNLRPAICLLESHGYIRQRPAVERRGPGKKPSPVYDINPAALREDSRGAPVVAPDAPIDAVEVPKPFVPASDVEAADVAIAEGATSEGATTEGVTSESAAAAETEISVITTPAPAPVAAPAGDPTTYEEGTL